VRRKYPDELRADLQRYYGVCIDDVGGSVSVRHAASLSRSLPRGSLTLAKINPETQWTDAEWMLFHLLNSWRDKDGQLVPPWREAPKKRSASMTQEEYERRLSMPRKEARDGKRIG
jgi:hypothetical protein